MGLRLLQRFDKGSFREISTHGKTWSWAKKSCRVVARENELEKDG
jgi:hypothetical protein